jgi:hypothetical protein
MNPIVPPPLFLMPEEVAVLTGYKVKRRQIDWLRAKGWRFELNANCFPIIARRYAEKMLGCGSDDEQPKMTRPNFAALRVA